VGIWRHDPDRILEEIRSARFKQMPIEALAGAGLITVEARSRRNPVVSIILPPAG
jgi:hypothetical protein